MPGGYDAGLNSEIGIRATDLSKCYHIYDKPRHRLLQMLAGRHKRYFREFWALKDVSFEVKKGETVGIIGRNGSGKSTLLQLLCGTLAPTAGEVEIHGRMAALLELGAGFSPEFTGRENIYLNASLYGLSREEIDARYERIAAFADIGQHIDQPVKTYSSGMYVRLGFAVVAHVDADILVIDEALAVGDIFFQQKCMRFLRSYQSNGGTILFVSHDMGTVLSLCEKALLLFSQGSRSPLFGNAEDLCKRYVKEIYGAPDRTCDQGNNIIHSKMAQTEPSPKQVRLDAEALPETTFVVSGFRTNGESFGEGKATIIDAGFFDKNGVRLSTINGDERVRFSIAVRVHSRMKWPAFGFMLKNHLGESLYTEGTDLHFRRNEMVFECGNVATATFEFMMPNLIRGKYTINVAFAEGIGDDHIQHHWIHDALRIDALSSRTVHGYSGTNAAKIYIEILP
jgi:lipopolysaccharide transport system ATP-binding protein